MQQRRSRPRMTEKHVQGQRYPITLESSSLTRYNQTMSEIPASPHLPTLYQQLVDQGAIQDDPAQREVVEHLQRLRDELPDYTPSQYRSWLARMFTADPTPPRGLYIYGGVGRGKSMLMDLYYSTSPVIKKRRVHFHAFMKEVHDMLHEYREKAKQRKKDYDPIPVLARTIARQSWLLCFDEFQVTDIADAMILGRLFTYLFDNGVVVIATSNRAPDDLYKDGLQREGFLPFIALLKQKTDVIELCSATDYRLNRLKAMRTMYYTGEAPEQFANESFASLTHRAAPELTEITSLGRVIALPYTAGAVAKESFHALCEKPLGPADYIEIARYFNTLILTGIPELSPEKRNEAKRFVTLVDALYEHKVKLICTADVPPEKLYPAGHGAFEFERTVSRLMEMQAESYLHEEHKG